ncbi:hypothetical protein [Phytohalomonas tamaricis]|uniref:hypothetical protein n=1 Tax=Phytohalomonas tamaricis TaxID=2081032 RepID=UPI000D0ABF29|nr:hypothetical protein [Phytohalomonas tamaricis]
MNARDYLAKQGIYLDKEEDKPNTLEEKAWQRARNAGHERPRSGTPHDWEDWEQYHARLGGESGSLEQKFNADAHGKTSATRKD